MNNKPEKYRIERVGEIGKPADTARSLLAACGYDGMEFEFHRQIAARSPETGQMRVIWAYTSKVFALYIDCQGREYSMNRNHEFVHLPVCHSTPITDRSLPSEAV